MAISENIKKKFLAICCSSMLLLCFPLKTLKLKPSTCFNKLYLPLSSGSWWWTGRPGILQSMRSQRVRHD